jgi:Glycosyl transferases group 1
MCTGLRSLSSRATTAETFGRVAAEALAYGRPVITTGLGGLGEIVDAQSGWVTGVDAGALADAIHEAAADDDAVATRGAKGRERHRAHFSPEATTGALTDIYERVLREAGQGTERAISIPPGTGDNDVLGASVDTTAIAHAVQPGPSPAVPPDAPVALAPVRRPRWLAGFVAALVSADAVAMGAATLGAKVSWFGFDSAPLYIRSVTMPYNALALVTVPLWLVLLALAGAYDVGPTGAIRGHWKLIVRAGAQLLAVVAVGFYVLHLALLGRGMLVALIPLAVALTLALRAVIGASLARLRRRGRACRPALVIGRRRGAEAVVTQLQMRPSSGLTPADVLVLDGPGGSATVREVTAALARTRAEVLVVTGGLARGQLRDLAWALEGTGIELLVTPAPAEMEGLRADIRPIAGLPLLYLDR